MTTVLTVLAPGVLTTVQDQGRHGHAALGVPAAGAADPLSLRIGNRLLGNPEDAAALELTLQGGSYAFDGPAWVALAGSDFGAVVEARGGAGERLPPWMPRHLDGGDRLVLGATRSGARCYLCVRGGLSVPRVLGSAATHLTTAMGGLAGRALIAGDRLAIGPAEGGPLQRLRAPAHALESLITRKVLRVTAGLEFERFTSESVAAFERGAYSVSESSDRVGLRLTGPSLCLREPLSMLSAGVTPGTIQIPGDGQPIVLGVDQPTTGGYPRLAHVVLADLPAVGQLRPRDHVRFGPVGLPRAEAAYREQEAWLAGVVEPV